MRFRLVQDNDCHWYLIPSNKLNDWNAWCGIADDDDLSWVVPEFARAIDGPQVVTFENPVTN